MVYCCVPFCKSSSKKKSPDLTFHSFPKDESRKKDWIKAISRPEEKLGCPWAPSQFSKICGKHFRPEDFSISTTKKSLLPMVTPSVFWHYSKDSKETPETRKGEALKDNEEILEIEKREVLKENVSESTDTRDDFEEYEEVVPNSDLSLGSKLDQSVQCAIPQQPSPAMKKRQRLMLVKISKLKKRNRDLKEANKNLKEQLKKFKSKEGKENVYMAQAKRILTASADENQNLKASFLTEQILAFGGKKTRYDETTLKISILLSRMSTKGYELLKSLDLLHLPHRKTLKKYVVISKGETGVTTLGKARLKAEVNFLEHENQKIESVIIDEM